MPRRSNSTPTPQDIGSFIERKDDLALELFTYRAFLAEAWNADHGHFYRDPILGKPRQFDVQGSKDLLQNPATPLLPTTGIRIAAECKNIDPAVPVIVSRVPRAESESYHCLLRRTTEPYGAPQAFVETSSSTDAKPYHVNAMVGKSIIQYSTNEGGQAPDDPYAKWSQALASCASLVEHAHARALTKDEHVPELCFILPALILADGALWTVDYDATGVRGDPQPADKATFYVNRDYSMGAAYLGKPNYRVSHLHIYTKTGFVNALRTLNNPQCSTEFERYFKCGINKILSTRCT